MCARRLSTLGVALDSSELLATLRPWFKTAGITRVANITGLDTIGIPVTLVTRPNSKSLSVSQGKGVCLTDARISGVAESLEQFCAENIELPLRLAAYGALAQQRRVVDVFKLARTPRPLDEWQRLLWITARECGTGEAVEVPYEVVHLDMTEPLPEGSGFFPISSNGLASGVDLAGAICHGVWELIERDALALFYERTPLEQAMRRLRLASVADPVCQSLLEKLEQADIGVAVWDMTTDVAVATFMCALGERQFDPLHPVGMARGYGCHPDRATALRRAITEAAQGRLTRIAGSRDDFRGADFEIIRSREALNRHLEHVAQECHAELELNQIATYHCNDSDVALDWTRQCLHAAGLGEPLYVDLSRTAMPLRVARSIVAGLEGFPDSPGYHPGERLKALSQRGRS